MNDSFDQENYLEISDIAMGSNVTSTMISVLSERVKTAQDKQGINGLISKDVCMQQYVNVVNFVNYE